MGNGKRYEIKRVLNNNSLVARDEQKREVVLLGKGIGFQKAKGEIITSQAAIEKVFVLSTEENKERVICMFSEADEDVIRVVNEYVQYLEKKLDKKMSDWFMLAFMDHISFAVKRLRQGIQIHNPFLHEVRSLYAYEYELAREGVCMLEEGLNMTIPDDEIGFIALHLHSVRENQSLSRINRSSMLISRLVQTIESELEIEIDKTSFDYARLLTHLRFAIQRAEEGIGLGENHPLSELLRKEYPICYSLSYKLVKIMQNELQLTVPEAEASYLTLHIQRMINHVTTP
ncbi:PRD domain-containing protein [Aneurinibacillus thermoaerophilus]|uniref:glucose PTS transporter transcription antiterminator GlcT n=1 Tax=Aneurinibacillus thermoaerophilus TaxID=143495 RepID=UPI002E1B6E71|nr:PRD domain-containing protein [Aneurinibacillus thermoaerophilus]MED0679601.1 PRD domain-containing protein [Aneurinibacillus thermoaerophilus]MED0764973.1 PRD domain-containing protein [Aneurinibacillus thermoaerophilus]